MNPARLADAPPAVRVLMPPLFAVNHCAVALQVARGEAQAAAASRALKDQHDRDHERALRYLTRARA